MGWEWFWQELYFLSSAQTEVGGISPVLLLLFINNPDLYVGGLSNQEIYKKYWLTWAFKLKISYDSPGLS